MQNAECKIASGLGEMQIIDYKLQIAIYKGGWNRMENIIKNRSFDFAVRMGVFN